MGSLPDGTAIPYGSPYRFQAISMTDASGDLVDMEGWLDLFYGDETGVRCVTEDYEIGYHEDKLLEYAETWIAESVDAADPFFLYYSPWLVHTPDHLVTDHSTLDDTATEQCASNDREMLCTMVAKLDESVGKVRGYLEDNGVDDETIFWFLSDNGGVHPNSDIAGESSNFPYRGGKTTHFEGGIKLQSLMYAPSLIKANMMASTRDDMFRHIDILPTILDAVGIEPSGTVDGQSVLKTIKNSAVKTGITSHEANVHVGRNAIFSSKMTDHDLADRYPYSALIEWPHNHIRVPQLAFHSQRFGIRERLGVHGRDESLDHEHHRGRSGVQTPPNLRPRERPERNGDAQRDDDGPRVGLRPLQGS